MRYWILVVLSASCVPTTAGQLPAQTSMSPAAAWKYVVPAPGDPFDHPPLRLIALSDQRPDDLQVEAAFRGKKQRYAQLRYGSPDSVRVAIVVDEVARDRVELYVDARRTRIIKARDRVPGQGLTWQVPVDVAVLKGDVLRTTPRTVCFRYGPALRTLSYATCGYVEGKVRIGDRVVTARRVDGDGNGFLVDPQDRLWLDLDGTGRWDPIKDQFPYGPIMTINDERLLVKSDPLGERLTFAKLEGTGTVQLALPRFPGGEVEDVTATIASSDGIVATLHGKDAETVLPVGDYRCTMLLLLLRDADSGELWGYLFSESDGQRKNWHKLARNTHLTMDLLGRLDLRIDAGEHGQCAPSESLSVAPNVYAGESLRINAVFNGWEMPRTCAFRAEIALLGAGGQKLCEVSTGFG